ncbi:MAG: hypothetical protein JWR50_611 [Mucilaginibacter sp.]|nr:hypothetical protein [Mucilaginibacter sp.]
MICYRVYNSLAIFRIQIIVVIIIFPHPVKYCRYFNAININMPMITAGVVNLCDYYPSNIITKMSIKFYWF